jgi:Zn-dependent peptidase ImmA (M78 family)
MQIATPSEKARDILRQHWNLEFPVNVGQIAKALGMTIEEHSDIDYSGRLKYVGRPKVPVIEVNANDVRMRQRFTIAHEIGHHALGHGEGKRDTIDEFSLSNTSPVERAANQFAAELLMPESRIRNLIFEEGIKDLKKLASKADVSQVAMQYRLKNLGLFA